MSKRKEHIHYLEVLRLNGSVYQPEVRTALDYAIRELAAYFKNKSIEGKKMKRGKVFAIIIDERDYQDMQQGGGRFEKKVHTVGEELLLMKVYLDKAIAKYASSYGAASALHGIRKVAALAVRCMENHGALPRELKNSEPHPICKEETEDEVPFVDGPKEEGHTKEKEEEEDEVPF